MSATMTVAFLRDLSSAFVGIPLDGDFLVPSGVLLRATPLAPRLLTEACSFSKA